MNKLKTIFFCLGMSACVAVTAQSDRLNGGDRLNAGQTIFSANHKIKLVMQNDGNLVLYTTHDDHPIWASATNSIEPRYAVMQEDGNFVVYNPARKAVWSSNTYKYRGAFLVLQNDGNMVIYQASKAVWSSGTAGKVKPGDNDRDRRDDNRRDEHGPGERRHEHNEEGMLAPNARLVRGQSIVSEDKKLRLSMMETGELALYKTANNEILWSSMTIGTDAVYAVMQNDGNLGIFNNSNQMLWSSRSEGHQGSYLMLQRDGNMTIGNERETLWSSGTIGWVKSMLNSQLGELSWDGRMLPGDVLYRGQYFISPNKKLRLNMQDNGNLVLFANSSIKEYNNDVLWSTMTKGTDAAFAIMQADGNLVLYNDRRSIIWSSKTGGNQGAYLSMEKDGNMIIRRDDGKQLWQ